MCHRSICSRRSPSVSAFASTLTCPEQPVQQSQAKLPATSRCPFTQRPPTPALRGACAPLRAGRAGRGHAQPGRQRTLPLHVSPVETPGGSGESRRPGTRGAQRRARSRAERGEEPPARSPPRACPRGRHFQPRLRCASCPGDPSRGRAHGQDPGRTSERSACPAPDPGSPLTPSYLGGRH